MQHTCGCTAAEKARPQRELQACTVETNMSSLTDDHPSGGVLPSPLSNADTGRSSAESSTHATATSPR
eukprot:m.112688 g.112688  ORF g.112688 m.112688 type:complete len:68 (+) comp12983_c0_seq1:1490-1693(+)